MRITAAFLADYASVREGLTHVIGGGINRIQKKKPGSLQVYLVLILTAESISDFSQDHRVTVKVIHRTSEKTLTSTSVRWEGTRMANIVVEEIVNPLPSVPLALPLRAARVSENGDYFVEVTVDGAKERNIDFIVEGIGEESVHASS